MTDLRSAAKMALDVLTAHYQSKDEADVKRARVIIALRQALAQPEQFQLVCKKCGADRTKDDCKGERIKCGIMGEAPSAQPEQEPVADITSAVDAAMVEMSNIHPPLRRTECERLIKAALYALGVEK